MKTKVWMLALSLALGYAVAQDRQPADRNAPQAHEHENAAPAANMPGLGRNAPSEMKTAKYKGELVDVGCRQGAECKVSANSERLGMKMADGRTMRFDLVGNERTKEQLKSNKHWTKTMTDGKPIRATVSGAINGDKMIVSSIH